jgi:HEAT repeat protein
MRKRIIISASVMAALLTLGFFAPDLYWLSRGAVCGEAFYAGKPTSYWRGIAQSAAESNPAEIWYSTSYPAAAILDVDSPDDELPDSLYVSLFLPPNTVIMGYTTFNIPEPTWNERVRAWKQSWLQGGASQWGPMSADPDAIPVLRELFHDQDDAIRARAVVALCGHGKAVSGDLPDLLDYLRTGNDADAKRSIAGALPEIGGVELVPTVCGWLNESNEMADHAAIALRAYGADAERALPHLIRNLGNEHGGRTGPIFARIGDKSLPALARELKSDKVMVRRHATHAVGCLARRPAALPLLIEQLKDADPGVRCEAVGPLGRSRKLDGVCAALRAYNDDPDASVQAAALASVSNDRGLININGTDVSWLAVPNGRPGAKGRLEVWLKAADKENDADLRHEATRALDKFLRSK